MSAAIEAPAKTPRVGYFANPWRKPRILQTTTLLYLMWSLLPVLIAVGLLVQRRPVPQRVAGVLVALVDVRPDGLPPARRRDPRGDGADLQAGDHHRPHLGAARHAVRDRDRPVARASRARGELHDAAVVRGPRDHPRRVAVHPVHEPAERRRLARHERPAAGAHQLPDQLSGDHRARTPAVDRTRIRGGRHGPRRDAGPGDPPGAAAVAGARHPRERRAGLRGLRGRLRDGRRALRRLEQRDAGAEDLFGGTLLTHARGQRGGHDDAHHDLARDRRRADLLQAGEPRSGDRAAPSEFVQL